VWVFGTAVAIPGCRLRVAVVSRINITDLQDQRLRVHESTGRVDGVSSTARINPCAWGLVVSPVPPSSPLGYVGYTYSTAALGAGGGFRWPEWLARGGEREGDLESRPSPLPLPSFSSSSLGNSLAQQPACRSLGICNPSRLKAPAIHEFLGFYFALRRPSFLSITQCFLRRVRSSTAGSRRGWSCLCCPLGWEGRVG